MKDFEIFCLFRDSFLKTSNKYNFRIEPLCKIMGYTFVGFSIIKNRKTIGH